jgi:hypothetical protein
MVVGTVSGNFTMSHSFIMPFCPDLTHFVVWYSDQDMCGTFSSLFLEVHTCSFQYFTGEKAIGLGPSY